jgi:propionate CoA-transferase
MKIISKEAAARLVKDGAAIGMSGFVGNDHPETLSSAIEERFLAEGHPCNLTVMFSAGIGDSKTRGSNHFGNPGMTKRIIGGHYGLAPRLGKLITDNQAEAYNLPQGIVTHLFRAAAGKKPGVLSTVGLGTFVDPRVEGGKLNSLTTEDIVKVMEIDGKEYLFYQAVPLDVAIIRASTADESGNLTMEREAVFAEAISIAGAAKAKGGIVIAEVEHIAVKGTLDPKMVKVPGLLVDYVVIGDKDKFNQTWSEYYNPSYTGDVKIPLSAIPALPLDERKIIARRAAMELVPNSRVNLGIGMPEGVAAVAAEEGFGHLMTLTVEAGGFGGVPAGGLSFGATINAEAMIDHSYMFDFYDGGNLDLTCLGIAQVDSEGNLNVSKFGPRVVGCGGFINISQNAQKVVFCGTLTAGGLAVNVEEGKLKIVKEGKAKKFIRQVEQVTFSGKYARSINQPVLYITERAVFRLEQSGLVLTEIAPGVDLEKDVLAQVEAEVKVSPNLKLMDERIFKADLMMLAPEIIAR